MRAMILLREDLMKLTGANIRDLLICGNFFKSVKYNLARQISIYHETFLSSPHIRYLFNSLSQ